MSFPAKSSVSALAKGLDRETRLNRLMVRATAAELWLKLISENLPLFHQSQLGLFSSNDPSAFTTILQHTRITYGYIWMKNIMIRRAYYRVQGTAPQQMLSFQGSPATNILHGPCASILPATSKLLQFRIPNPPLLLIRLFASNPQTLCKSSSMCTESHPMTFY